MTDRKTASTINDTELDQLYDERDALASDLAELTRARQHGAFTFCPQQVGHVTVAEFARKISEKRTALAHREEAVQYANEQKQRADQAEELLRIAHDTSNKSEAERARAVQRADLAEAALARVRAAANRWQKYGTSDLEGYADILLATLNQPAPAAATQATDEWTQQDDGTWTLPVYNGGVLSVPRHTTPDERARLAAAWPKNPTDKEQPRV